MITRNRLIFIVGVLAVLTAVLGYQYYQERQKTSRVEIEVGAGGITIEKK